MLKARLSVSIGLVRHVLRVKALAAKSDHLSLIPRSHKTGTNHLPKIILRPPCTGCGTHTLKECVCLF